MSRVENSSMPKGLDAAKALVIREDREHASRYHSLNVQNEGQLEQPKNLYSLERLVSSFNSAEWGVKCLPYCFRDVKRTGRIGFVCCVVR